jgi:ribonuclease HI
LSPLFLEAESTQHIFIHCAFTRMVWSIITSALNLNFTWDGATLADCFENWSKLANHSINLPPMVCWFIWIDRNTCIFENKSPSATTVAYKSLGLHHTWTTIHPRAMAIATMHKTPTPEKSHTGWFDGASQSNGTQSGTGGVLHLSTNTYCRWTFNCGQGSNTRAELLGAWASLLLASRLNLDPLLLYGDSRIIIDWLNNKNNLQVSSLFGWMERIQSTNILLHVKFQAYISRQQQRSRFSIQGCPPEESGIHFL